MVRGLTSPVAQWTLLAGMVWACGACPTTAQTDDRDLRSTADPALLPVPEVNPLQDSDDGPISQSRSRTTQKLVLVSAEIDAHADEPHVSQLEKGSSSRKLRKAAIEDLPLERLSPQKRQAANVVIGELSVFRRLPAFQCELDPRVHDYFTEHPDVAVSIWRAMAISQLQMTQTSPSQYSIDTLDGTTGVIQVLHQSRESCLVYCEGMFKSPYLNNAIRAKSLMHLRAKFGTDQEGRTYVTHQADLFVSFPSQKVDTIAKLISPVSNTIIDRNFQEISLFIHVMWQAMAKQPGWVEHIAEQLDGVAPARKDELTKLTAEVYVAAQATLRQRSGLPVSLEVIQPPKERRERSTALTPDKSTR